jgi:hypothetical protein
MEIKMKMKLLMCAAAMLFAAGTGPSSAQEVVYNPGYCAQFYPNANCQNKGPGNPYRSQYRTSYRSSYNSWDDGYRRGSGFWPADAAAGAIAGAVGTAGAIATAPFSGNSYAYDNGYRNPYVASNGFVCEPGTWFRGEDGRRHLCQ